MGKATGLEYAKQSFASLARQKKYEVYQKKEWYTLRRIIGNWWANYFIVVGARQLGKTFDAQKFALCDFFDESSPLYHKPFYWMRLNDIAVKNMLMNNGAKLFEPILYYQFGLNIKVSGDTVYHVEEDGTKLKLCYVWGLSTAYNNKGAAIFDKKTFRGANILIDEFALEKGQKRTFDVVYNLKMQIENICRHERKNVRIFMFLNNTDECPGALAMFNFIPFKFGTYKLKRKHCVMDYVANNEAYEKRRKEALANELDSMGGGTGNFTNQIQRDTSLLFRGRLTRPTSIVKFTKQPGDWYTIWDNNVVCPYKGEKISSTIPMRRYLDDNFNPEISTNVIEIYDARGWYYKDLLTYVRFTQDLQLIKSK